MMRPRAVGLRTLLRVFMSVAIVTGSGGLIGSEVVRYLARQGLDVVGIDNNMRAYFFGNGASTRPSWVALENTVDGYIHVDADIRDTAAIERLFASRGRDIALVVHAAGQPSHDWAATEPAVDFSINAGGTLNLLEATRRHSPDAVFVLLSTNKVYGDTPNRLPLEERATRWELAETHPFSAHGIDESVSLDRSMHSLFGVSKCSADLMVQEYGRYFGMRTACLRCGCVTGPGHAGAVQHGFLAYLVKCAVHDRSYEVIGHGGKQVRDNIHSFDLADAIWQFFRRPLVAAVYNMGGGRFANCSIIEAIALIEAVIGRPMRRSYRSASRPGDHIWWVSDTRRFQSDFPDWGLTRTLDATIREIHQELSIQRRLEAHGVLQAAS
jgi:CDP-paratose 2-epimerase